MIGKNQQDKRENTHRGYADIFTDPAGNITLRSHLLHERLKPNELYSISQGSGTHSIALILVKEKPLDLKLTNSNSYMSMIGNDCNYVNLEGILKGTQKDIQVTQNRTNEVSTNKEHQHLSSGENVNSSSNNQDEHTYEYVNDIVINSNENKAKTSLKNIIVSLFPCCLCHVKMR
ncbi:hypothetical protein [Candidatus Mesenet endosymbiont of Agriotes lineatus]|uniref:hypothetical protein n=1 Tax=Candidatus Mesenet endosymbiont of Agriotes lineatus TaxID=3077948 RepID=UPI0030CB14A7